MRSSCGGGGWLVILDAIPVTTTTTTKTTSLTIIPLMTVVKDLFSLERCRGKLGKSENRASKMGRVCYNVVDVDPRERKEISSKFTA